MNEDSRSLVQDLNPVPQVYDPTVQITRLRRSLIIIIIIIILSLLWGKQCETVNQSINNNPSNQSTLKTK